MSRLLRQVGEGHRVGSEDVAELARQTNLARLIALAGELRDAGHGHLVSYSKKVFLPLTHLCRDVCHYCVFAQPPKAGEAAFMSRARLLEQAQAASAVGCKEALFTLGDKPELRYKAAREGLRELGHETTLSYLREAARLVFEESGLLPHLNPGLMTREDLLALRPVSASMGLMLESVSDRLMAKGEAHHGSPDKIPARRLETLRLAGEVAVPFTSGLLIGIGETRLERVESLLALRRLQEEHGHLQEVIIQNFRTKPGTRMAAAPEPDLEDLLWTIAVARILFGREMSIQAPPNLSPGVLTRIVEAGINDWGGVSPLTPDFVNPEAPWPHLDHLARETEAAGKLLVERLTVYPGTRWRGSDGWMRQSERRFSIGSTPKDSPASTGGRRVQQWRRRRTTCGSSSCGIERCRATTSWPVLCAEPSPATLSTRLRSCVFSRHAAVNSARSVRRPTRFARGSTATS